MQSLPAGMLMERAATGLVSAVVDVGGGAYGLRVVLLVGIGDNGGDALLAGSHLATRGARVDAVLLGTTTHDHLDALLLAGGRVHGVNALDGLEDQQWWQTAEVVIDGIVGIGGVGGLREPAASVVAKIPDEALVIAVDMPSGVDADTGEVHGVALPADLTVCMGTYKTGLLVEPGSGYAGKVQLVDIGLNPTLPEPVAEALQVSDVVEGLPIPAPNSDKFRRGVVGVVAGSSAFPGAAVWCVAGAIRAGAGYVRLLAPASVIALVHEEFPEVVAMPLPDIPLPEMAAQMVGLVGQVQSWVIGPGAGTDEYSMALLQEVLESGSPVLLDADALTLVSQDPDLAQVISRRPAATLMTPHAGELARLLAIERSDVEARPLHFVQEAAVRFGCTVLLKGPVTLVAHAGRPTRANSTGTSWLGTAGSGDVLSGLAGTYLAAGLDPLEAGSMAAFIHGVAGQLLSKGDISPLRSRELADALPDAVAAIRGSRT